MQAKLLQLLGRLEALSLRERAMVLLGIPLALVAAGEMMVFGPARQQTVEASKQADKFESDLKALSAALAARPAVAPLPRADELLSQRNELQRQIDAARAIMSSIGQTVDWGTVVRATVAGTPGLTLTQLKTMPAELVFSPSMVKPPPAATPGRSATAGSAPTPRAAAPLPGPATAKPVAAADMIYRHRAELTITGDFGSLLAYLQTLQRVPGDLRWSRLQLSTAAYPQASAQLGLSTLSNRAETPFN